MKKNRKQYLVVGLGRFGSAMARSLVEEGMDVLGLDTNMSVVEAHRSLLTETVCGDGTDRQVLEQIGATDFDVALVSIGADFKISGVVTMHLKEMGVKCVMAKAYDEFQGRILSKLGADKVLFPERDMAQRIAHNLVSDRIMDFLEISPNFSMLEMYPKSEWVGKKLKDLDLRKRESINIIAVRTSDEVNILPDSETVLRADDKLLLIKQQSEPKK